MTRSRTRSKRPTARNPRSTPATWNAQPELAGLRLWLSFFDEQDRDAVDDRIKDFAARAAKVVRLLELELGGAFRTRENLEQFLRDHPFMVVPFRPCSCGASPSLSAAARR